MSKRKITKHQRRRIEARQAKYLSEAVDAAEISNVEEKQGLVVAHHGKNLEIETSDGQQVVCRKRQHLGSLVPGDRVSWRPEKEGETGVVLARMPRTTLLSRPNSRGQLHAVASNIDQVFVVIAPKPQPSQTTVDRYLLATEVASITPIVILNKSDLLSAPILSDPVFTFFQQYQNLGYTTLQICNKTGEGITKLSALLQDKISVFVGQSGVGKSSIISSVLPEETIKVGKLSTLGEHGKHTTTTARLYHFSGQSGSLIDSPGIREFPLWPIEPRELANGFIEFRPFLGYCKFRNCLHQNEKGCALLEGLNQGKITADRLNSYQKLLVSMQENAS